MKTRLHKILSIFLVAVMLLTAAPLSGFVGLDLNLDWLDFTTRASAATYSGTCGDNLTWTFDESTGELIITGTGDMSNYSSDSSVPWYAYRSSIKSVTIPDSVTTIGDYAFDYCTSLTSITIPDSVTTLGNGAFMHCDSLNNLTIPDSVTTVGNKVFAYCGNITSIIIPGSITSMGFGMFSSCDNLTNVTIGNGLKRIGEETFYYCYKLESVTIADSVTIIDRFAFRYCYSLKYLSIPGSADIYFSAFDGCTNLEKVTFTKGNGTALSCGAGGSYIPWRMSSTLKEIVIEDGVTGIGTSMFSGITSITSITIPDSVTSIGYNAFYGCTSLKELTIPVSAKINNSFNNCTNIEKVTFTKGNGFVLDYDSSNYKNTPWYISRSNLKEIVIEDGVTGIGSYMFCETNAPIITVPASVTSIGEYAFEGCSKSVLNVYNNSYAKTYAENNGIDFYCIYDENEEKIISVTVTPNLSFEINKETYTMIVNCNGNMPSFASEGAPWAQYKSFIKYIIINDGCTSISDSAFKNFQGVKSITIPNGVIEIGSWAFSDCDNIENIKIPNGVTSIGDYAFYSCNSLTGVTIPDSVAEIGEYAFRNCTVLTSVIIPEGITTIEKGTFRYCESLTSVTVPGSVMVIGDESFAYCSNLADVYYNGTKVHWDKIAFGSGNECLKDTVIHYKEAIESGKCGDGLTWECFTDGELVISGTGAMYDYSYNNCPWNLYIDDIKSVVIGDGVTTIGSHAFKDFTGLTSAAISNSITIIGNSAFYNCVSLKELTIPASARIYNSSNSFYNCSNIEKITLIKGDGTVQNYSSSSYASTPWYQSRDAIKEIVIEDGVTSVGSYMFYSCSNLINITLPLSVQSIGNNAFADCNKLEKLKVYNRACAFNTECTGSYTTICGYAGSTAEAYANENGLNFELIPDDDHRHFYSNSCDADCDICGYINPDAGHTYDNTCDAECNICGYVNPDAGHVYDNDCDVDCNICGYTRTISHTDDNDDGVCDVCEKILSDIAVGVTQNFKVSEGETVYIKFVPEDSGIYTFCSSSGLDTYGYVFDVNKNMLASNDDDGSSDNFSITYTFNAGIVYYLGVRYYNPNKSGEIPVTITLDELVCNHIYRTVVANPTCQSAGIVAHYCTVCKYSYVAEIIDPVDHDMRWVVVTKPTSSADGGKNYSCSYCGLVEDTKVVPAFLISDKSVANIDFDSNTISGFDAGAKSIDDYVTIETDGYSFTCDSAVIGTGTVVELTDGDTVITEFTAVVFGDVNGDGWYDGTDSIIVSCLANGLLSKDDVSPAFYTAADCNHDGVIDSFDVALLEQAGVLLANVDQSKSSDELATDEAYIEYLDLIDQSPDEDVVEDDVIETPEEEPETEEFSVFELIIEMVKKFIEFLLSRIPVPYK